MPRRRADGPSLPGLAGIAIGFPVTYLAVEGLLPGNRHPLHWLIAAAGAAVSYAGGDRIERVRGAPAPRRPGVGVRRRPRRRRR